MYDFTGIENYPVAVLGGGSVGRTCAADCELAGNTVRIFDIKPFSETSLKYLEKTGVTLVGHPKNKPELFMEQYLNGRDCTMNPQKLIHAANYPHPHEKKGIKSL